MDLKFERLRSVRIQMESAADLNLDLNEAKDLDLSQLTFAGSDDGDDLESFLAPRVGNYDYLDIDEEDLKTIPSPDVDASVDPEVEQGLLDGYEKKARGDGAGGRVHAVHQEHLRETRRASGPDVEAVLVTARKAMMAGYRGDDLAEVLAGKFDREHLLAAAEEIQASTVDQHLLGNVILEPELFASCDEMEKFLKMRKTPPTAKLAKTCGECQGCPQRAGSFCKKFGTTLVREMPDAEKVFNHYAKNLQAARLISPKTVEAVKQQAPDFKQGTAALFAWASQSGGGRREAEVAPQVMGVPERRVVVQTPRDAAIRVIEGMNQQGWSWDKIKSATAELLGKTPFGVVAKSVLAKSGEASWQSFGACDHPLLMDRTAKFRLEPGNKCGGCVHNYGTHCAFNQRVFTRSFVDPSRYAATPDLISEDERLFEGVTSSLDVSPSLPSTPSLEASDIGGLDEGFEV